MLFFIIKMESKNVMEYIYIYVFSRRFYPKWLTIAFRLYIFCQYMCSLGIEPTTFRAADTMLYHWATQNGQNKTEFEKKKNDLHF